jgi:hypothetical protein
MNSLMTIVALKVNSEKLSSSGTGGKLSTIGKYFKVSKGNTRSCFLHVLVAVLPLQKEVISWPSAEEKRKVSRRFYVTYRLPNCIGMIDGTCYYLNPIFQRNVTKHAKKILV